MQKVRNKVKLLLLNKAETFSPKKQINFWFTVNVALLVVSFFHASAKHHGEK